MDTKSRETIYGASILATAERASEARKQADRLAVEAWNKRMLQQSPIKSGTPVVGHVRDIAPLPCNRVGVVGRRRVRWSQQIEDAK